MKEAPPNGADDAAGPATPEKRTLHKADSDDEPLSQMTAPAGEEGAAGKDMYDPAGDLFKHAFSNERGAAASSTKTEPMTTRRFGHL